MGALNDAGSSIKTKKQNHKKSWFSSGFLNLTCKKTFVFIEEPASFSAPTGGLAGQQMGVSVLALAPPSPNYLIKG